MSIRVFSFAIACALMASTAAAQDTAVLPSRVITLPPLVIAADGQSPADRFRAIELWTREYGEWKAWHDRWRNQSEPGWFSKRARRTSPQPPAWLPAICAAAPEEDGPVAEACRAWREWSLGDEGAIAVTNQIAQARASSEAPVKTLWWERVHVDALWPMTQTGSSVFGVAGMHATFHMTKRFQVFLAPGAILVRLPSIDGHPTWSAATDWGFSYSLFDFSLPGMRRPSTVHFNIARVWVLGAAGQPLPGELYLAGLSLTFKQR